MRGIVENCIYAHITIPNYPRMTKLLETLHTRPDLAYGIITFDGSLYPVPQKPRFPRVVTPISLVKKWCQQRSMKRRERTLCHTAVSSIRNMVNVKSLTLSDFRWLGTSSQTLVCKAICSTTSLTSLTTLVIQGREFSQSQRHSECNRQLCLILRHQPLLERLELRSGDWDLGQWILPTDIPHLTHLTSRPEEAKFLVPGRPIASLDFKKLSLMPRMDIWDALAASTSPIRTLKVDVFQHNVLLSFLRLISSHLQDLQNLALIGPSYDTLPLGFPHFSRSAPFTSPCGII
ncbi:hypothetical protein FRB95_008740 [Tulasnella sp. JGI-2019a]|nr:hypothetical protein FRB95_008740 [Tulasnella sp. JGI-2019a]